MNEIQQNRQQFFHPTTGKVRAIKSWELLTQRALECKFREYLNDRTIPGLVHCCSSWLTMANVEHCQDGLIIIVEARYAIECLGTHKISPRTPSYKGDYLHVKIG